MKTFKFLFVATLLVGITLIGSGAPHQGLLASASASCTATVQCEYGPSVFCSGSQCSGEESNCDLGVQGHVTCGGVTTYCDACEDDPSACIEGAINYRPVFGECCGNLQKWHRDQCVGGQWQFTGHRDCFDPCGSPLY